MRPVLVLFALAAVAPALALADDKPKPAVTTTTGNAPRKQPSLDDLMNSASPDAPPPAGKTPEPTPTVSALPPPTAPPVAAAAPKPTAPPPPPAPITDDNDATAVAAAPAPFKAPVADARPRVAGAYELSSLDCRVIDGAGIERVLPKKVVVGEEPDLLCRLLVTQPATVASAQHQVTLTVQTGNKLTYQQVRNVRISAVGRRAIVFVIPADRISVDDTTNVIIKATLSAPARPAVRDVRLVVESLD